MRTWYNEVLIVCVCNHQALFQVDHLQNHLISSELFTSVADPSVSLPPKGIVEKFRGVAVVCTCRSYKRRPELDEVGCSKH